MAETLVVAVMENCDRAVVVGRMRLVPGPLNCQWLTGRNVYDNGTKRIFVLLLVHSQSILKLSCQIVALVCPNCVHDLFIYL